MNTTKEGIEVVPGQVWRDLDPRMNHRTVTVLRVQSGKAYVRSSAGRESRLSIQRMHRHATGFALVQQPTGEEG